MLTKMTSRRNFLQSALATTSLPWLPACVFASPAEGIQEQGTSLKPWFRLSLAEWSYHRTLFAGKMTNLDFPAAAAELGFEGVEYVNQFFKDKALDKKYLAELKKRCSDSGVESLLIMCDGEGALGDPDKNKRRIAVENHLKWLDAAKTLGCHSIRVNAQSSGTWEEQAQRAASGLRSLTEEGAQRGLSVIVENHGGLSSNGSWLSQVIRAVNHPGCGTLPDFGNFNLGDGETYDRYEGISEMMPFAKAVSAKSHEFNDAGNEIHTDYSRMLKIVKGSGYRGFIGVEYEGGAHSERDGIVFTRDLLLRYQCS